jgi:hypothetical protein
MTEQPTTCGVGRGSDQPCTNPATERLLGSGPWICEGHALLFELADDENDLQLSLAYLERWIRIADWQNIARLRKALRGLSDGFAAELAKLEAKQAEIKERYGLPPGSLEQLEAKQRDEEPEPESETKRRWREADQRASRFNAAIGEIEGRIEGLMSGFEESVLPLLEEEAKRAGEAAERVKAKSGL